MWEKYKQDSEHSSVPHAACMLRREQEKSYAPCSLHPEKGAKGKLFPMQPACWRGNRRRVVPHAACMLRREQEETDRPVLLRKDALTELYRMENPQVSPTLKRWLTWYSEEYNRMGNGFSSFSWLTMSSNISSKQSLQLCSVDRGSWILIPCLHIHVSVDVDSHAFLSFKTKRDRFVSKIWALLLCE